MATLYRIIAQIRNGFCAATCLGLILIAPVTAAEFDVVALTGQQAPGAEAGVLYESFSFNGVDPHLNAAGQVMFAASLTGTNVNTDNDGGLWIADSNSANTTLLGRQGNQAPGVPTGVVFGPNAFLKKPPFMGARYIDNLNNAGQFVYWADLAGSGINDSNNAALWTGTTAADTSVVARTGDQAAGFGNGIVYSNLLRGEPVINANGQIAFSGQVSGAGITHLINDDAIWTGTSSNLDLFLQADEAAPGTTEKFRSHYSSGFKMWIDDQGQMQVWSWLTENGTDVIKDLGLWSGDSAENLSLFARSGDPAPGLGSGVVFNAPFLRHTTASGKSISRSILSGPGITPENNETVWLDDPVNGLELIARQGDPNLPGSGGNLTDKGFSPPLMNEAGTFLYETTWGHVTTNSTVVSGIHRGTSAADLELIAGGDEPVPGLDPAWRLWDVNGISINNTGQFVFQSYFKESLLTNSIAGLGIWGYEPDGTVSLLVKTGDQLEVAPGDWRTIGWLKLSDGSSLADGTRRGLTEDGDFLFHANFTDGSEGFFVGGMAVPEPSSLLLSVLATVGLLVRRRRNVATVQPVRRIGVAAGLSLMLITTAVGAEFEVVAVTGQQVPGMEAGVLFGDLTGANSWPQMNDAGQVSLNARLTGTGVNDFNDGGLWVVDTEASTFSLIARQGDQVPGAADGVSFGTRAFVGQPHYSDYRGQPWSAFNDAGQFVTWADLTGPGVDASNDSGLWTGTSYADMALLARTGGQAAGMPEGVVYTNLLRSGTVINSSGQVAISGRVSGPGVTPTMNEDAVWTGTPTGLSLVVRQGELAPGTTEKFALHKYTGFATLINDTGELQIHSLLSSDGVFEANSNAGLWTGSSPADIELFAHNNDPAPGLGAGVVMASNYHSRPVTSAGHFVFGTGLSGPGVTRFVNSDSVWIGTTAGDLSLVVQQGDPSLPGSGGNLTREVFYRERMNELGTFVFLTQWNHVDTDFPYVFGIHRGTSADDLELMIGGDQPVPGLDPSLRLRSISGLSINDTGQFVFNATIGDTDPTNLSSNTHSIYGYDPIHGIQQLLLKGDQLEVEPGDMRTVKFLSLASGSSLPDGTRRGLTDDGRFLFRATFTDDSIGYFVGSIAVPEPGSLSLLGFGTFAFLVRRRHVTQVWYRCI